MRLPVFAAITVCLWNLCASAFGMGARRPEGYTLVLVPDQYGAVQITHDLSQLHPVVMASYEQPGNPEQLNVHVFQDSRWLPIAAPSFQSGAFLKVKPTRTIVVGPDNAVTAALLNSAGAWNSQQVLNIPFNNGTDLINWYGKYFNFSKGDYRWFANKYGLDLKDQSQGRSQTSWYDQPYREDTRSAVDPTAEAPQAPAQTPPPPVAAPPRAFSPPPAAKPAGPKPRSAGFQSVTTVPGAPSEPPPSVQAAPVAPKPAAPKPALTPPPVVTPPAEATRAFDDAAAPTTPLVNEPGAPAFKGWKSAGAAESDAPASK